MTRTASLLALLLALVAVAAAGCGGSSKSASTTTTTTAPTTTGGSTFKVGLSTDTGGLNDRSFNHLAYVGMRRFRVSCSTRCST